MKVSRNMMNKELRFTGSFIRTIYKFRTEKQFIRMNQMMDKHMAGKFPKDIQVEERYISGVDDNKIRILICYPKERKPNATGTVWFHGGGYAIGIPEIEFGYVRKMIRDTNTVVVLPDYRRSTEAPYPAAMLDCYETVKWVKYHAGELGINKDQIFIGGESAGGGLTAAVSLYARDQGEVNIAFQMPLYPMLDARMNTDSERDNDAPVWDYKANELAWNMYLKNMDRNAVSVYASPALAENYENLPPTYTFIGTIEPFYDETKIYIQNLKSSGVKARMDAYEGCFHAFDLFGAKTKVGKQASSRWLHAYQYATEHFYKENIL